MLSQESMLRNAIKASKSPSLLSQPAHNMAARTTANHPHPQATKLILKGVSIGEIAAAFTVNIPNDLTQPGHPW